MQKRLFTEFSLPKALLDAIHAMGFEEASPIQTAAIPVILEGSDVVGLSQTGSGKTAAYAIPAVALSDPAKKKPQVLVLCPTRELAVQVAEEFAKLIRNIKGFSCVAIYGGQAYDHQIRALRQGAQIVIATPGRLMDHWQRGTLDMSNFRYLVLDEADRMLDMGFREEMDTVLEEVPEDCQKLFFSATMPKAIQQLIQKRAPAAKRIEVAHKELTVPSIDQRYYEVKNSAKLELLHRLIDHDNVHLGIIFCNTKQGVDDLASRLQARSYSADRLHGDMTQAMRQRVLEKFKSGQLELLVATDVAARGLDVDSVEVVFNYDLPHDEEDYVHRIGRTGRAGRSGRAISLVSGKDIHRLQQIIRYTKAQIRREVPPSLDEVEARRMDAVFGKLRTILEEGNYKKCDLWIDRLLEQGYAATDMIAAAIHMVRGENKSASDASLDEAPSGKKSISEGNGWPKIFIGVGKDKRIRPSDIKGAILGESGIDPTDIGQILLFRKHTLVEIAPEQVEHVIKSLRRSNIRNNKLIVRQDRE